MRAAASFGTLAWLAVVAASFSEKLEFISQPNDRHLVVFSWLAPSGHSGPFGADVVVSSGRGIQAPHLKSRSDEYDVLLTTPQGTRVSMTHPDSTKVATQCAWCSWFETVLSEVEQRIDNRLWQAAGLRACSQSCPPWHEGEALQHHAVNDRLANSVFVTSTQDNGSSIYHPMVVGLDSVLRAAFLFGACGGRAGTASLLDQGALASSMWWRMRWHVPLGGDSPASLRVAMLLPGDRPTGPASMLAPAGKAASDGMHKLALLSASQQHENSSLSSLAVPTAPRGAPPLERGGASAAALLNRKGAVNASARASLDVHEDQQILYRSCSGANSSELVVEQHSRAAAPATKHGKDAPVDLLLPLAGNEPSATQLGDILQVRSSLEHTQRGMGRHVVVHDVTAARQAGQARPLQLLQLLPQWLEWQQNASDCTVYLMKSPGRGRAWPCDLQLQHDALTHQASAVVTLTSPAEQHFTVRIRLVLDGYFMPVGAAYPSDAHRGFDLPPAHAQLWCAAAGKATAVNAATPADCTKLEAFGHPLPIEGLGPDFSMPYNVVTVSLTILASVGGGLVNLLLRWGRLHATKPWPLKSHVPGTVSG